MQIKKITGGVGLKPAVLKEGFYPLYPYSHSISLLGGSSERKIFPVSFSFTSCSIDERFAVRLWGMEARKKKK